MKLRHRLAIAIAFADAANRAFQVGWWLFIPMSALSLAVIYDTIPHLVEYIALKIWGRKAERF